MNLPTGALQAQTLLHQGYFQILECVGIGGLGAVYKALDLHLNKRVVALKEMSQDGLGGEGLQDAINSFTREAEMLAHLKHQNLPHVYAQFEEGGRRYLVMEFIEGETLAQRLYTLSKQGHTLPLEQVFAIGKQLCNVLEYLHTQQPPIIFRDLKPANIMLGAQERAYLIDFGIARLLKPGQAKDTVALGSPGYAPPEQYRKASSPRSDIYSLGATLHQMITGADPSQNPFYFQRFSVNLPDLERLIMRMVSLDEQQRPASLHEIRKVLDKLSRIKRFAGSQSTRSVKGGTRLTTSSTSSPVPLKICVVVSADAGDLDVWAGIRAQLSSLLSGFPAMQIRVFSLPGRTYLDLEAAIDEADLILLLLSPAFLSQPDCILASDRAMLRRTLPEVEVLPVLLRACTWQVGHFATIPVIPEEPVAHLSIYAQEKSILNVAKAIREALVRLLLHGKTFGPMSLLQWLLWQIYGRGRTTCPFFITGHYVLKRLRNAGETDMRLQLFDMQTNRSIAECLIESPHPSQLSALLNVIAPSAHDSQSIYGVASRQSPLKNVSQMNN
jgi:serine/threonine protein kinase